MDTKVDRERPDAEREARLAEERALLAAQRALQRLINAHGLRYRDLARRLGVSEARVSHMLGDDASNLTMRTLARAFHTFGEGVVIMSTKEFERAIADAGGQTLALDATWHVPAPDFVLWDQSATEADHAELTKEPGRSAETLQWALADDAQRRRRRVAG